MNELLFDLSKPGCCRVALLRNGRLGSLDSEPYTASEVGTIFKGRVDVIEPNPQIQAAFLNLGLPRRGFLHVSDVEPALYSHPGRRPGGRNKPPIETIFQRGQEVAVQLLKEGVGPKGPILTTYLTIPGRYLVFMPCLDRLGVSRKIEDGDQRRRLLTVLRQIVPPGMGVIARASSLDRSEEELRQDLAWLLGARRFVSGQLERLRAPAVVFRELPPIHAALCNKFTPDIDALWVKDRGVYGQVRGLVAHLWPGRESCVRLHEGEESLFAAFGLPDEMVGGQPE